MLFNGFKVFSLMRLINGNIFSDGFFRHDISDTKCTRFEIIKNTGSIKTFVAKMRPDKCHLKQ